MTSKDYRGYGEAKRLIAVVAPNVQQFRFHMEEKLRDEPHIKINHSCAWYESEGTRYIYIHDTNQLRGLHLDGALFVGDWTSKEDIYDIKDEIERRRKQ